MLKNYNEEEGMRLEEDFKILQTDLIRELLLQQLLVRIKLFLESY